LESEGGIETVNMTTYALVLVTALLLWPTSAEAYLDAGSGSMLLQLVLGGVAGLLVILKLYWQRVLSFLGLRRDEPAAVPEDTKQASEK
jgi:hypothetical protein